MIYRPIDVVEWHLFGKYDSNQNYWARKIYVKTSKMILFDSIGWHDNRLLVQHPPHRLTRVHGGNTNIVGSFASDPSDNFNGTTVISGIQLAGVAIRPALRSTPSPLKRAANINHTKKKTI